MALHGPMAAKKAIQARQRCNAQKSSKIFGNFYLKGRVDPADLALRKASDDVEPNCSPYCSAKKDYEKYCAPPVTIAVQQWPRGNVRNEGPVICI